jgi:hypothetical protein
VGHHEPQLDGFSAHEIEKPVSVSHPAAPQKIARKFADNFPLLAHNRFIVIFKNRSRTPKAREFDSRRTASEPQKEERSARNPFARTILRRTPAE